MATWRPPAVPWALRRRLQALQGNAQRTLQMPPYFFLGTRRVALAQRGEQALVLDDRLLPIGRREQTRQPPIEKIASIGEDQLLKARIFARRVDRVVKRVVHGHGLLERAVPQQVDELVMHALDPAEVGGGGAYRSEPR